MPMPAEQIVTMIESGIPGSTITIEDLRGDQDHYAVKVVSNVFHGLSRPAQHKLVYQCLGNHVGTTLHALSITTATEE